MDPNLAVDLFWISLTINVSVLLLFAARKATGWLTSRFATEEFSGSWKRKLFVLQDEKPFILPRFLLIIIQAVVLSVAGVSLLVQGDAIQTPFYNLSDGGRVCFAINIGCYMYLIVQDAILQRYLVDYYVTFMHHMVTCFVYLVFLQYRENALGGTMGLLFAGATPFYEAANLLNDLHVEPRSAGYAACYILSGCSGLVFRLGLPMAFVIYSFVVSSPFVMDILVLACFFLSIVFFGMINTWFVFSSWNSLQYHFRSRAAWTYMKPLQTGKPHGLQVELARRKVNGRRTLPQSFTTKRNDLSYLPPCSNTNLASAINYQAINITKDYHKINISSFLKTFDTELNSVVTVDDESLGVQHSQVPPSQDASQYDHAANHITSRRDSTLEPIEETRQPAVKPPDMI